MPSNKKKNSAEKKLQKQARQQKQEAAQAFSYNLHTNSDRFRQMLLHARKEYSKGRSYEAVELQNEALQFGEENLPHFNENSLVKAHALVDLGLAKSAIMSDFATGEEWERTRTEMKDIFQQAVDIFEARRANNTLTKYRREECWIDAGGNSYSSPVPHTERLGPIDYFSAIEFHSSCADPSEETIRVIKACLKFFADWKESGMELRMECGGALQGDCYSLLHRFENLESALKDHKDVVSGLITREDTIMNRYTDSDQPKEVRHSGSREGTMKSTHKKLERDNNKTGIKCCENKACGKSEAYAKQFATCSRCGFAAYCCRDCQKVDWKRHKLECKEKAEKAVQEKIQNENQNCLMVGESQNVVTIVSFLHHFAALSDELQSTETQDAGLALYLVKPKVVGHDFGTVMLGIQDVAIMWNAIWSMTSELRERMMNKFIKSINKLHFPKGGPNFDIVFKWHEGVVHGIFSVVIHTKRGSILLHEDDKGNIKGYLAVGISQSVQQLLASVPRPLPLFLRTGLIPFKKMILCQGTVMEVGPNSISHALEKTAIAFINGDESGVEILERMPGKRE